MGLVGGKQEGTRDAEGPRLGDEVTKALPKEDDLGSCAECIGVGRPWRQGHLRGRRLGSGGNDKLREYKESS